MTNIFPINANRTSWDTTITQSWDVEEATSSSGRRRTLTQQTYPNWKFSVKFPHLTKSEVNSLIGFYAKMKGKWGSFYYQDFEHHHIEDAELTKQGNNYYCQSDLSTSFEPVSYVTNLKVYIDGVQTNSFTQTNGVITFENSISGTVTATYDYYYLVSFGKDLSVKQIFDDLYTVSLDLVVVRE